MRSASIAALAISSIPTTFAASILPQISALAPSEETDLLKAHGKHPRNLQGEIQHCKIALAVGDINRDDLLNQSEYLRFVNQLGRDDQNNDYVAVSVFDELPQSLKQNYDYFADAELGQIDISGSKPGQVATSEQDTKLIEFCELTSAKIRDPNGEVITIDDPIPPSDPDPTGDDIPGSDKDCSSGTIDRGRCNVDLSISDSFQNDLMDEADYVKFVNRLSKNKYANSQFEQLPLNIKQNYNRFAIKDGQVDISGSKPGQRVSVEQDRFLNAFCCETDLSVQNPSDTVGPPPVQAPSPDGSTTPAPTFDLFFCQRSMASSDLNRDDNLTKDEYVIFLNRLSNNQFVGQTYDNLNAGLQANFENLIGDNGQINIYGSKPGQTTNFEEDNALVFICVETGNALNEEPSPTVTSQISPTPSPVEGTAAPSLKPIQPSVPPSAQPVTQPPNQTVPPGRSEVYNSFIISNRGGLTAANLTVGTLSRDGLDKSYGIFVQTAVESFTAENDALVEVRSLRRRKLAVSFLPDSDQIYRIVDSDCPEGLPRIESCQTAFAKFELVLEGEDAQDISASYTEYTQELISEGELQVVLKKEDKRTILKIVDASFPVTPEGEVPMAPPTSAPTGPPTQPPRKNVGAIVGGLFCAILLLAIIGYIYFKGLPFELPFELPLELPFELPSFPNRGGARVGNKADDNDDEVGLAFGQDDDDASDGMKNAFGKDFGRNSLGDGDDDGEEQREKSRFGFSNKTKKSEDEDVGFGIDSKRDSLNDVSVGADEMYAFEEPSEIDSETENLEDQRSASDIDFGTKSDSSNWGTNNVFDSSPSNQGWGANGGEDNFFGTSPFADDQEERELSQSGSEDSESYSSEDETYESGEMDETEEQDSATYDPEEGGQEDSYTGSSADESYNSASLSKDKMSSTLRKKNEHMDAAIDNGDWDAVVEAAKAFDKGEQESMVGSSKRTPPDSNDEGEIDESYSDSYSGSESSTSQTTTSEDRRKRAEYRAQVEELVRIVLPDETEKVYAMMDQFKGREAELVSTLQTMEERSSNQRARAAIHKSKPPSQQNAAFGTSSGGIQGGEGSTAGTAAIAAVSLPIPAEGVFDGEQQDDGFGAFGDEDQVQYEEVEGSEYSNEYDDQSYYSEEDDEGSGSFFSDEEESVDRSYYSEEGSQQRSFYSQEGEGSEEGSFYSQEEGSQQRSFYSQEEGESIAESYYSEEGSKSYYSGDEESYDVSGDEGEEVEEGSFYSEEESTNDQ
jgi:hypothetical protein